MNDAITTLTTLDYVGIIGSVAAGIIAIKSLFAAFEWAGKKLGNPFEWQTKTRYTMTAYFYLYRCLTFTPF